MSERDLARDDRIVVSHVRLWIVRAVLELDVHAGPELLEVEAAPVDPDRVTDATGLLARGAACLGHPAPPLVVVAKDYAPSSEATLLTATARITAPNT